MEKLFLKNVEKFPHSHENHDAWENFNINLAVEIGNEGQKHIYHYKLNIISTMWLENATEKEKLGVYLSYSLVMKYYDEQMVKKYLENVIKGCSNNNLQKSLNCLTFFLHTV